MEGLNILTNPVWEQKYCSPTQVIGVERYRPAPCAIGDLPRIDAVCVCAITTTTSITRRRWRSQPPDVVWPLGLKQWFAGVNISMWWSWTGGRSIISRRL